MISLLVRSTCPLICVCPFAAKANLDVILAAEHEESLVGVVYPVVSNDLVGQAETKHHTTVD